MLKERLSEDLKAAMKAKDEVRLRTIRLLRSALMNAEIGERQAGDATLTEEQELAVLQKQAKQRREAIEQFERAGRTDLSAKEMEELSVIEAYLPRQMDDAEIREVVAEVIAAKDARTPADIGKVMGEAVRLLKGKADGRKIQQIAQQLLSGAA